MQGLAQQIQLDEAEFSFNASGGIDTSGMLTSSKMLVDFLAAKEAPSEYLSAKVHSTTQAFWDFDAQGRTIETANIGRARFNEEQLVFAQNEEKQKIRQLRAGCR